MVLTRAEAAAAAVLIQTDMWRGSQTGKLICWIVEIRIWQASGHIWLPAWRVQIRVDTTATATAAAQVA